MSQSTRARRGDRADLPRSAPRRTIGFAHSRVATLAVVGFWFVAAREFSRGCRSGRPETRSSSTEMRKRPDRMARLS